MNKENIKEFIEVNNNLVEACSWITYKKRAEYKECLQEVKDLDLQKYHQLHQARFQDYLQDPFNHYETVLMCTKDSKNGGYMDFNNDAIDILSLDEEGVQKQFAVSYGEIELFFNNIERLEEIISLDAKKQIEENLGILQKEAEEVKELQSSIKEQLRVTAIEKINKIREQYDISLGELVIDDESF